MVLMLIVWPVIMWLWLLSLNQVTLKLPSSLWVQILSRTVDSFTYRKYLSTLLIAGQWFLSGDCFSLRFCMELTPELSFNLLRRDITEWYKHCLSNLIPNWITKQNKTKNCRLKYNYTNIWIWIYMKHRIMFYRWS
jgi:hypothetical protein